MTLLIVWKLVLPNDIAASISFLSIDNIVARIVSERYAASFNINAINTKIIAGTLTGVLIRSACIHSVNAFTKLPHEISPNMKFKSLRNLFTPSEGICKNLNEYKNAMGTILATVVMMFTNFLIDAPLTKFLTNKFVDKIHNNASKPQNSQPAKMTTETKEVKHD